MRTPSPPLAAITLPASGTGASNGIVGAALDADAVTTIAQRLGPCHVGADKVAQNGNVAGEVAADLYRDAVAARCRK